MPSRRQEAWSRNQVQGHGSVRLRWSGAILGLFAGVGCTLDERALASSPEAEGSSQVFRSADQDADAKSLRDASGDPEPEGSKPSDARGVEGSQSSGRDESTLDDASGVPEREPGALPDGLRVPPSEGQRDDVDASSAAGRTPAREAPSAPSAGVDAHAQAAEQEAAPASGDAGAGDEGHAAEASPSEAASETCKPSAPGTPRSIAPANGAYTGSTVAAPSRPTLRPRFRWSDEDPGDHCTTYHLQIDDSCSAGSIQSCAFSAPIVDEHLLSQPEFRPTANLPVSTIARPIGRRYFWRVRACRAGVCSPFGATRYVDVGRGPSDFDGDSVSDTAVSDGAGAGDVFVIAGPVQRTMYIQPVFPETDASNSSRGRSLATADFNADGFADLAIGSGQGVYVHAGGPDGIATSQPSFLKATGVEPYATSVAAGDWNGDGFADLAVGATYEDGTGPGYVNIYYGTGTGLSSSIGVKLSSSLAPERSRYGGFGYRMAPAGDVDGDGNEDLVVGAPFTWSSATRAAVGAAFIFRGSPTGMGTIPWSILELGDSANDGDHLYFGKSMAAADVNQDGYSDVAVAQARAPMISLYLGGATPPNSISNTRMAPPTRTSTADPALTMGDFNDDGWPDLAAGDPMQASGAKAEGNTFIFYGNGRDWAVTSDRLTVLDSPNNTENGHFGTAALAADVNGDDITDLLAGAPGSGAGHVYVFLGAVNGLAATPWSTVSAVGCSRCDQFGMERGAVAPLGGGPVRAACLRRVVPLGERSGSGSDARSNRMAVLRERSRTHANAASALDASRAAADVHHGGDAILASDT